MHVYVCLFACMLGRRGIQKKKKKKNKTKRDILLLSGRLFLQRGAKQNEAIFCCERDAAEQNVVIAICCNTHTHT